MLILNNLHFKEIVSIYFLWPRKRVSNKATTHCSKDSFLNESVFLNKSVEQMNQKQWLAKASHLSPPIGITM